MSAPQDPQSEEGPRLMVVDDLTDRRVRTLDYFRRCGYRILAARSGVEAIAYIIQHPVDAVIIQGHLPGLSSYDTIPILKRLNPNLRVVMTVPPDAEPDPTESTDFIHCFLEPIRLEEIERAIRDPRIARGAANPRTEGDPA